MSKWSNSEERVQKGVQSPQKDECLRDQFEEVFLQYQERLYNLILRIVPREEEALDVLQETLLRAYKGFGKFEGHSQVYTWLFRIATNCALSYAKQQQQRKKRFWLWGGGGRDGENEGRWEEVHADTTEQAPFSRLELSQMQQQVQEALMAIKEEFRVPVILRDMEGLSYEEISEILQISVGTVKSRIFRGREQLRKKLLPLIEENSS